MSIEYDDILDKLMPLKGDAERQDKVYDQVDKIAEEISLRVSEPFYNVHSEEGKVIITYTPKVRIDYITVDFILAEAE